MPYPTLGIDVAKATFAVALSLAEDVTRHGNFSNDSQGFGQLKRWVQRHVQEGVWACLEATGRYSDAIAHYLYGEAWVEQVSVLNPSRIHAYARSQMRRCWRTMPPPRIHRGGRRHRRRSKRCKN